MCSSFLNVSVVSNIYWKYSYYRFRKTLIEREVTIKISRNSFNPMHTQYSVANTRNAEQHEWECAALIFWQILNRESLQVDEIFPSSL